MNNKRIGAVLLLIGIVVIFIVVGFQKKLNTAADDLECYPTDECREVESFLTLTHFSFGIIGFILALGFYMIIFSKGEEAILSRLEEDSNRHLTKDKFDLISKALDKNEKIVLGAIKEQDGITQQTLRYKTDLSKAAISQILTNFEKKGLIKRELRGKTYSVHLTEDI